jgi:hypothetical protein
MNNFGQVQVIYKDTPLVVYLSPENGLLATPDSYTMDRPLSGQSLESFCLPSSPTTSTSRISEHVVTQPNDTFRFHQNDLEPPESAKTTGKKRLSFQCAACLKVFTRKYDCNEHKRRIHDGLKPHPCEICGRAFFKNSEMVVRNLHIFFNRMGRLINYFFIQKKDYCRR